MIHPSDEQVLAGVVAALKDSVLPELARGSAARKQLQAALEILHRIAYAMPRRAAALEADNADMAEVIGRMELLLPQHSPSPSLPHQGGGLGEGDAATSANWLNLELQEKLASLQQTAGTNPEITALLTALYSRMTDRALALIPPPMPRTPRKTS